LNTTTTTTNNNTASCPKQVGFTDIAGDKCGVLIDQVGALAGQPLLTPLLVGTQGRKLCVGFEQAHT
jgi:hypothetical protein